MPLASPGQGHTQGTRRGVSPVAQQDPAQGASSFLSLQLQARRSIPAQSTCAQSCLRETSTSIPRLRGTFFNRTARRALRPRNRPPLLVPHMGFLAPRQTAPRASSSRTPAPRPGRRQRAQPCPQSPVLAPDVRRVLSPPTPLRTPTLSSPPPPPDPSSRGSFPSIRCFVSDVKSRPLVLMTQAPPKRLHRCRHFRPGRRW